MSKIALFSDLHREVSLFSAPPSVASADVVVLAGDIDTGLKGVEWASTLGKPVVYVAGNHEYDGCDVVELDAQFRAFQKDHPHVHILQEDRTIIDGVRYLGCTLWSDFEFFGYNNKAWCMANAQRTMPEYQKAKCNGKSLTANDTLERHVRQRQWLKLMLDTPFDGPTVVVTHHAPHVHSIAPQYHHDGLTAAFVSNMEDVLGRPILWCHGHTHQRVDYWVDDTRIVSHPRGYHRSKDAIPSSWDNRLLYEADSRNLRLSRRKHKPAGTY